MNRRTVLSWMSRLIAVGSAAVVAIPGVALLIEPLRRRSSREEAFLRVARLDDVRAGVPKGAVLRGDRRDAWTVYPQESIGRVWLMRSADESADGSGIVAFTNVCPHLGCAIHHDAANKQFVCPCHKGVFKLDGSAASDADLGYPNPAPRGMDRLESRVVTDEATGERWVEVRYQKFAFGRTTSEPV